MFSNWFFIYKNNSSLLNASKTTIQYSKHYQSLRVFIKIYKILLLIKAHTNSLLFNAHELLTKYIASFYMSLS